MQVNSELKDAQVETKSSDVPWVAQKTGLIYLFTDKLKMLFGTEVKTIATEDWVETQIGNVSTGLDGGGLITSEQVTISTPDPGKRTIAAKSDGIYEKNSAGTELQLATEQHAENYTNTIVSQSEGNSLFSPRIHVTKSYGTNNSGATNTIYTASKKCRICIYEVDYIEDNNSSGMRLYIENNTPGVLNGMSANVHPGLINGTFFDVTSNTSFSNYRDCGTFELLPGASIKSYHYDSSIEVKAIVSTYNY